MDQNIIDKIATVTNTDADTVEEAMNNVPISDLYSLIDASNSGDTATILKIMEPLLKTMAPDPTLATNESLMFEDFCLGVKFSKDEVKDQFADWLQNICITFQFLTNNAMMVNCKNRDEIYKVEQQVNKIKRNTDIAAKLIRDDMKDKNKISGSTPKPRDPMAKALSLPQYQPKKTPNKKELLDKTDSKHKKDPKHLMDSSKLDEGVMGMTDMQALNRMLQLAGVQQEPEVINLGSVLGTPDTEDSVMAQGPIDFTPELNAEVDALGLSDEPIGNDDYTIDAVDLPESNLTNIQTIRDAFETIRSNMPYVQISEFAEVRAMVAELNSSIDRMGNLVTGR